MPKIPLQTYDKGYQDIQVTPDMVATFNEIALKIFNNASKSKRSFKGCLGLVLMSGIMMAKGSIDENSP